MYNILKERNKSIRTRWMIDFSLLILIICMINYIVVSLIYKDLLKEKKEERSKVAINAISIQQIALEKYKYPLKWYIRNVIHFL